MDSGTGASPAPSAAGNGADEHREGGSRRRRGRRGRGGDRGERAPRSSPASPSDPTTDETVEAQPKAALVVATENAPATYVAPLVSSTLVESHDPAIPVHTAAADVTPPAREAMPSSSIPAPAAVPEVVRAEPAVARAEPAVVHTEPEDVTAQTAVVAADSHPAMETVSMSLPPDSDLVLVETRFAPVVETEEPAAPRARRVRPARAVIADEPLQMVETRKEQPAP